MKMLPCLGVYVQDVKIKEKLVSPLQTMANSHILQSMSPRIDQGINSASLCSLAGRYDNTIPTRFLAPTDCLKVTAHAVHAKI